MGGSGFIKDGTTWKLAGINYGVDGPYNTSTSGDGFLAAIFDEGGLYKRTAGNWTLTLDLPIDVPGGFYATRISAHLPWINGILQSPSSDSPPTLRSAATLPGPYEAASGATVNATARTVTVPVPTQTQFYRLQACDPLRMTGISVQGSTLVITYE